MDKDFLTEALAAGFTEKQAEFLFGKLALDPHTHTADEIWVDEEQTQTLEECLEDSDEE